MTLHTVFLKENDVSAQNPINGVAQPRWSGLGCQQAAAAAVYGQGFVQSKAAACLELNAQFGAAKEHQDQHGMPNTTHFTLFSAGGDCKTAENGKTPFQTVSSVPTAAVDYLELGFGQPMICAKYPYPDQCYGVYSSSYGPQFTGRIMLPLNGGPIFVNAKQYNGIMRRRKKRAEAVLENKIRRPYLHLSRHLHAKRRPRGNGGRFLNTKSSSSSGGRNSSSEGKQMSESSSPGSDVSSDHDHLHFPTSLHLFHGFHPPFPDVAVAGNYLKV